MKASKTFTYNTIALLISASFSQIVLADDVEFNTDVLSVNERTSIDLSRFSKAGYIAAGDYLLSLKVNGQDLGDFTVKFEKDKNDSKTTSPCITPEMLDKLGLTNEAMSDVRWSADNQCLEFSSLPGFGVNANLATATLEMVIPKIDMEYSSTNWDPVARWDDGIPGILFDYNVNAQTMRINGGESNESINGNGTAGLNVGPWRVRADWQTMSNSDDKGLNWSRIYAYRALRDMKAKLTLGEDYLNSDVFDSFRFMGASLASDESMIAPHLRGYSPEVSGVAKTNARVIITQEGRVIYDTRVAAGAFRIQDLSDSVSGTLDVRVEEQDGSVQTFQVDTANIPYLTRPGQLRYKLALGKTSQWEDASQGEQFASGEFSWGVSNGWSLYGGSIASSDYQALSVGIGRDLLALGAVSADITSSRSMVDEELRQGSSYRLSYSKQFDDYDSQISFAGYRFADEEFMTMSDHLDAKYDGNTQQKKDKEMYNISFNKSFTDLGISAYLSYSHSAYWNQKSDDRYNLTASKYMNVGPFRNVNLNVSAYQTEYENQTDNGIYLSMSMPLGDSGSLGINSDLNSSGSQRLSYSDRINERNSYNISAGVNNDGGGLSSSGSFTHEGDMAEVSINASRDSEYYSSASMSVRGGVTLTAEGAALHRMNQAGGTRLLVDTRGVSGVPIDAQGADTHTNIFGKAVVNDISNFYRNNYTINVSDLADDVDAPQTVVNATLTEGAIGYRKFEVVSGKKMMATITMADHSTPPLGAEVTDGDSHQVGIVGDDGMAYLSGLKPSQTLQVLWDGKAQCKIVLPDNLNQKSYNTLLLPCK